MLLHNNNSHSRNNSNGRVAVRRVALVAVEHVERPAQQHEVQEVEEQQPHGDELGGVPREALALALDALPQDLGRVRDEQHDRKHLTTTTNTTTMTRYQYVRLTVAMPQRNRNKL